MKKILFLLATVSLTLSSCLKEDETFKRLQPVMPGLNIYSGATTQQRIAMLPLDNVMRLGMLLAEGAIQQKQIDELPSMLVSYGEGQKVNVFDKLFSNKTTIEKTLEGDYTIKLEPEAIGYGACEGMITVVTNGVDQLADTSNSTPWTITLPADFKVLTVSDGGGRLEVMLEGHASVYRSADTYVLQLNGMKAYVKASPTIASDWMGRFVLKTPVGGESLAFSTCMGKKFEFDGSASGPSCVTFDGKTGAEMFYSVSKGIYKNSLQCLDGTEKAKLTGFGDYDSSMYPASEVQIDWVLSADERSQTRTITYNGYTVTY